MIRRVGDYSTLPSDSLEKIAKVVKEKENKKLYKTCSSEQDVSIAIKEIKLQGYKSEIEKLGGAYNVYSVLPETLDLDGAEKSGQFKKLAWGRYCFQKASSINGFTEYNYDDGSIWRVIAGEDGKQYLVKEVEDDNEDQIIRSTTASLKKKADNGSFIDDQNYTSIMQILYHNSSTPNEEFMNEILSNPTIKQEIYKILSDKMNVLITEKLQQQNVVDPTSVQEILSHIQESIDSNEIVDENTLESVIYNHVQEIMLAQSKTL